MNMNKTAMTKAQWKREQELRAAMALSRVADISISDAYIVLDKFRRAERKLQRLAEIECNGYPKLITEYRNGKVYRYNVEDLKLRAKCERSETLTRCYLEGMAHKHNLAIEFQGDPRGLMFRLTHNGQEINYAKENA